MQVPSRRYCVDGNNMVTQAVNFCNPQSGRGEKIYSFFIFGIYGRLPISFDNGKEGETVPEKWTGRLVGKMHNARITFTELACEMGVTKSYISMILNGKRKPEGIQKRMEAALDAIQQKRSAEDTNT